MKKILALLLVLIISATSMISCGWLFGNGDGGNDIENGGEGNGDSNIDNGGNQVIEEYDGDVNGKDNIDPDGWTKVDK